MLSEYKSDIAEGFFKKKELTGCGKLTEVRLVLNRGKW